MVGVVRRFEREQRERADRLYEQCRFENVGFAPGPVPSRWRFRRWVRRLEEIGYCVIDAWELEDLRKRAGSSDE
jgi:hypothetical protein